MLFAASPSLGKSWTHKPALVILTSLHNLCIVRQGEQAVCWDLGCGKIMAVTRRNSVLLSTFVSGQKMTAKSSSVPSFHVFAGTWPGLAVIYECYLVDPASSHMLVSKIKPCMSKYTRIKSETAKGSLYQLWFLRSLTVTWITVVILELIHAIKTWTLWDMCFY